MSNVPVDSIGAFTGVNGKARQVVDICAGAGGLARRVKYAYIGDENGTARLFYRNIFGIKTPDNMTSDTAPAPYKSSAKNIYSGTYPAWRAFNNSSYARTPLSPRLKADSNSIALFNDAR